MALWTFLLIFASRFATLLPPRGHKGCLASLPARSMKPELILCLLLLYFALLLLIAHLAARSGGPREGYYIGKRNTPWGLVAFGMLGVSLSGVSFISVPGWVLTSNFHYMQMVLGYVIGYYAIAYVLIPIYYRLKLPTIYSYLSSRLGPVSYRTSATFFLLARTVVAALRLFVVASLLHTMVFGHWGVPFAVTVVVTVALIWLYTHRGGIQSIIWTDVFQTALMLVCLLVTIYLVAKSMDFGFLETIRQIAHHPKAQLFQFNDWRSSSHFLKQFLSGAIIPFVMTGLDQDMMQKNLGCKSPRDARKNMVAYGYAFIPVNLLLLSLGVLLVIFAEHHGLPLPAHGDDLYPQLALGPMLPSVVGVLFTLSVIAAAYSSADSALTALTTSFTIDILGIRPGAGLRSVRTRQIVQVAFSLLFIALIMLFQHLSSGSIIHTLFTAVGYTYGPILGIYAIALFTHWRTREWVVPLAALAGPTLSYIVKHAVMHLGYAMGYELLLFNALVVFALLAFTRVKAPRN